MTPSLGKCASTSLLLRCREDPTSLRLIPALCNRWTCPLCCRLKAIAACKALKASNPDTKIELTIPQPEPQSRDAYADALTYARAVPKIIRKLRRSCGPIEYAWTCELHRLGGAHVHMLARAPWIPQAHLSTCAEEAGLGPIVWIRRVDPDPRHIAYVAKYLFKAASPQYAATLPKRRLRSSHHMWPGRLIDYQRPSDAQWTFEAYLPAPPDRIRIKTHRLETLARTIPLHTPTGWTLAHLPKEPTPCKPASQPHPPPLRPPQP